MTPLQSLIGKVRQRITDAFAPMGTNRRGCSYAVTVITPIDREQTDALKTELGRLKPGKDSPLYEVPDVQFARWVIIDRLRTEWVGAPKTPSTLKSQYLLFSADLTAPAYRAARLPDTFFHDLAVRIPNICAAVWGKCLGCPDVVSDPDGFVDYLNKSQIEIGLYYAAFPDLTADEIAAALKVRQEFARFALEHQDEMFLPAGSPGAEQAYQALKNDYLRESATW